MVMEDENKTTGEPKTAAKDFESPREPLKSAAMEPETAAQAEIPEPEPEPEKAEPSKASRRQRFRRWYLTHKKLSVPLTVLAVLALLAAIPFPRYSVAAVFISRDIQVQILDRQTGAPVSDA